MANIVTPVQLHSWKREILGRLLMVTGVVVMVSAGIVALGLLPAYIEAHTERIARQEALQAVRQETETGAKATPGGKDPKVTLLAARKRLQAFEGISKRQRVGEAIAFSVEHRPKGMQIRSLTYVHKSSEGMLDIGGTIDNHSLLKPYADEFKGKELFSRATIPITSLARLEGGAFSLSVVGPF